MPTLFTEFRFFNRAPQPANATLHSGGPNQPMVQRGMTHAPPNGTGSLQPNADRQTTARIVVAPSTGEPIDVLCPTCPQGQFINKIGVTLDPDGQVKVIPAFGV
jgi:hypothetical protein